MGGGLSDSRDGTVPGAGLASQTASNQRRAELTSGARIGRYLVLDRLGAGGMGVVYAAYDRELDRRVAVKLLWPDRRGADKAEVARRRLQLEARAMARLTHENVVPVYDVGETDGRVFLAMELVEGQTLADWLRDGPRPWRDVVAVFLPAGRGLAAAHAAGLIHRDFKPHNVLIGAAPSHGIGRVRVTDFGLARHLLDRPSLGSEPPPSSVDVTATGTVVGTPAYMAPEQHRGGTVDDRVDQYSFCLALYEGLLGRRPFEGRSLEGLARAKQLGELWRPARLEFPRRLWNALARGLRPDPAERFESMKDLLAELERAVRPARWGWGVGGAVVTASAVGWLSFAPTPSRCEDGRQRLDGVWDDARRASVHRSLTNSELPYTAQTWRTVEERLDRYAADWVAAYSQTCRAGRSGGASDATMACLDHDRGELRALVQVLAGADEAVTEHATSAVADLPRVADCVDGTTQAPTEPPADVAEAVAAARIRLADARALDRAGKYAAARDMLGPLVEQSRTLGFEPLVAETELELGIVQQRDGQYDDAQALLRDAYFLAAGRHADATAASAAIWLVRVIGYDLARDDEARRWSGHARAALARAGGNAVERARLLQHLGSVLLRAGDYDESLEMTRRALEIREDRLGLLHPDVAASLDALGALQRATGHPDEATQSHQLALEILERELGPHHPATAACHNNLGIAFAELGEHRTALEHFRRSVEILEAALGPDSVRVGRNLTNLASLEFGMGMVDDALAHLERSLKILEPRLGPDHPDVGDLVRNIGSMAGLLGDNERAIQAARRAMRIFETLYGPDDPRVGAVLGDLGTALHLAGRYDESEDAYAAAIERLVRQPNPSILAPVLWRRGINELARGKPRRAVRWLQQAVDTHAEMPELIDADLYFDLATAKWEAERDAAGSGRLMQRALCLTDRLESGRPEEARRFLVEHVPGAAPECVP